MPKDDATYLNYAYLIFGLLVGYVAYEAFSLVGSQTGWMERYDDWFPALQSGGSVVLAIVGTLWLRSGKERHEYFLASIGELRKVTWPNWPDTRRMTIIVGVVVAFFAVALGLFDYLWAGALKMILASS